jgi:glutamate:Na+ symporter, ESS family
MITAAIATTSMKIFLDYALPLVIISTLMTLGNIAVCFGLGKRWLNENWFEIAVGLFGQCCGVLATGLMLIKVMDPSNETISAQCISTSSTLGYSWQIPYMVIGSLAIFTAPRLTTIISIVFFLFCLIGGEMLYGRKKQSI